MANKPILTPEQAEELIIRYQAGEKVQDLAKAYGITRFSISARLKRAGVRTMRRKAGKYEKLTVCLEGDLMQYIRARHPNPSILFSKIIRHIMAKDTGYRPPETGTGSTEETK